MRRTSSAHGLQTFPLINSSYMPLGDCAACCADRLPASLL